MRLAISTTETLTDLKTDLVVANNNNYSTRHDQSIRHSQHTHTHTQTTPDKHPTHHYLIHRKLHQRTQSSIVIPIPKPGKDSYLGTSYRPISLLCPAAKVMEALMLTTVNTHLLPAFDQHGFRPGHSTTSALLQLTSDVATGFNQWKPPHRTICVAVDLTSAFDTVNHNVLLSKIPRSRLPETTCRWLSNYIRGRQ